MTIWRMFIACWIPKATDTHSEFGVRIVFQVNGGYTNAHECYLYVHCLFCLIYFFSRPEPWRQKTSATLVRPKFLQVNRCVPELRSGRGTQSKHSKTDLLSVAEYIGLRLNS